MQILTQMNLNPVPEGKKSWLLQLFIFTVCIFNVGIVCLFYTKGNFITTITPYEYNLKKYSLQYSQAEKRFQNFSFYENYDALVLKDTGEINQAYRQSINEFSNMTQNEFYKLFEIIRQITQDRKFGEINRFGVTYIDWTAGTKNVRIKDQRGFNTSFIFAVLTSIEYRINRDNIGALIQLSVQEIIDCCELCMKSGKTDSVFQYIILNGVYEENDYPYENSRFNKTKKKCRVDEMVNKTKHFIKNYRNSANCGDLELALKSGPVVVGIDGRQFPTYKYSNFNDCQRQTTHYALLISMSYDHWKLQNSWGRKWGQRGYIRLNAGDTCGICLKASIPIMSTHKSKKQDKAVNSDVEKT